MISIRGPSNRYYGINDPPGLLWYPIIVRLIACQWLGHRPPEWSEEGILLWRPPGKLEWDTSALTKVNIFFLRVVIWGNQRLRNCPCCEWGDRRKHLETERVLLQGSNMSKTTPPGQDESWSMPRSPLSRVIVEVVNLSPFTPDPPHPLTQIYPCHARAYPRLIDIYWSPWWQVSLCPEVADRLTRQHATRWRCHAELYRNLPCNSGALPFPSGRWWCSGRSVGVPPPRSEETLCRRSSRPWGGISAHPMIWRKNPLTPVRICCRWSWYPAGCPV